MKFSELEIHPDLIRAATDAGFVELTPIQEQCLKAGLEGRDIAGISQTGTGKTVAFLLPILHHILTEKLPGPAALILTPTRELCMQIKEEAEKLCKHNPLHVTAIYGGEGYTRQEEELKQDPEVIVATPGRLIDYIKKKRFKSDSLKFLVLDEADRMFDMGFIRDIRYIMKYAPPETTTMLFSATLSYYVMRLASDYMKDPEEVRIESETVAVDKIDQKLYHLGRGEKLPYLVNQIFEAENIRGIVFTNTKHMVDRIVRGLRRYGIRATGISSLLDQKKRIRLLKNFKLGKYDILVATDVASRGLDVDDITHVFNYDLPQDAESYVHRIGRTARAGRSGVSHSYCSEDDYDNLPRIQRYLGDKIPVADINVEFIQFPQGEFTHFVDEDHPAPAGREEGRPRGERGEGRRRRDRSRRKPVRSGPGEEQREKEPAPESGETPRREPGEQKEQSSGSRRRRRGRRPASERAASLPPLISPEEVQDLEGASRGGAKTVRDLDRAALLSGENTAAGKAQKKRSGRTDRPERERDSRDGQERSSSRRRKRRPRAGTEEETRSQTQERAGSRGGQRRRSSRDEGGRQGEGDRQRRSDSRNRGRGPARGEGQGRSRSGEGSRRGQERRSATPTQKKGVIGKIFSLFKKG